MSKRTKVGLTSSQRLHFDIYGFVILRQVLTSNEIKELYQSLQLAKSMIEKGSKLPPIYTHRIGKHHIGKLGSPHRRGSDDSGPDHRRCGCPCGEGAGANGTQPEKAHLSAAGGESRAAADGSAAAS